MVVLLSLNFTWFTYPWNGGYEFYSGTERAFAAPWDGGLEMRRAGCFRTGSDLHLLGGGGHVPSGTFGPQTRHYCRSAGT